MSCEDSIVWLARARRMKQMNAWRTVTHRRRSFQGAGLGLRWCPQVAMATHGERW